MALSLFWFKQGVIKMIYKIKVKILVPLEKLNHYDNGIWGDKSEHVVRISSDTPSHALDEFHLIYPISNLEHFDIEVMTFI